jgi:hypothetical protein
MDDEGLHHENHKSEDISVEMENPQVLEGQNKSPETDIIKSESISCFNLK